MGSFGSPDEEEDEIVAEIDVILSQDLADQLYVLQYPLQPAWRGYDNTMLENVQFKANTQVLEMEYRLKEEDQHREQQTKISSATTGVEYDDPTKSMKTQIVRSTVVPNKSNYVVGLYRENELYVTPLKAVMQMRPSFAYIDQSAEARAKRKEEAEASGIKMSTDDLASSEKAVPAELKPALFQVKKPERTVNPNKPKSYQALKQQEASDPTITLEYAPRERSDSLAAFERITGRERSLVPETSMNKQDYMMAINPPLAEDGSPLTPEQIAADLKEPRTRYAKMELADYKARKPVPNQVPLPLSLHTIHQLDPQEQLIYLFNNANVLSWAQLHEYTTAAVQQDINAFFTLIENTAVLVQGVWVVKTDRSYKHRAANIRNWLLMKIALANPEDDDAWYLSRQEVAKYCCVSVELAASIMDPIVELIPKRGLKLKYAPDYDFVSQYPEKANKYNNFFAKIQPTVEAEVRRWIRADEDESAASTSTANAKKSKYATIAASQSPAVFSQAQARARAEEGAATKQEMDFGVSLDINEALESGPAQSGVVIDISDAAKQQLSALIKLALDRYGVISPAGLAKMAAKSTECRDVESPLSDVLALQELAQNALRIKNVFITPNGQDPAYEIWREIATDFAREGNPFKRTELSSAFRQGKGKEPTRLFYSRIVSELFVMEADGSLKLKTGNANEEELRSR